MFTVPDRARRGALALLACLTAASAVAQPPGGGSVSVELGGGDDVDRAAMRPFVDAAAEALAAHGFTILDDPGHAALVATLTVRRMDVGTGSTKAPVSRGVVGPGAGGVGVIIPLPSGNTVQVPLRRTELTLELHRRSEAAALWRGAAVTVRAAGTRQGTDQAVASALSEGLLRSYPAEPEGAIEVP